MPFCPYLGIEVPEAEMTREHIVPYAIGGSDDFVITVSKRANSEVGSGADGEMVNSFFMQKERQVRGIVSTSGNPPLFRRDGVASINGLDIDLSIEESTEGTKARIRTSVRSEAGPNGEPGCRVITSDEQEARGILEKIAQRGSRGGSGSVDIEKAMASAFRGVVEPHMAKVKASIRVDAFERGFAKIALAVGHLVLGESFSRSADARTIRRFMWEANAKKRLEVGLFGTMRCMPGPIDGALAFLRNEDKHVVAIAAMGDIVGVSILLFGSYPAHIQLSRGTMYPQLPHLSGMVFVVDPVSRALETHPFLEYITRATGEPAE